MVLFRDLSAWQTRWVSCPKSRLLTKWWRQSCLYQIRIPDSTNSRVKITTQLVYKFVSENNNSSDNTISLVNEFAKQKGLWWVPWPGRKELCKTSTKNGAKKKNEVHEKWLWPFLGTWFSFASCMMDCKAKERLTHSLITTMSTDF